MLQYELTGVWFVLTVIHINVELVSLENIRRVTESLHYALSKPPHLPIRTEVKGRNQGSEVTAISNIGNKGPTHPGDEAVTNILW